MEKNEIETRIIQRRCLRCTKKLKTGHIIKKKDIQILRPAILNALLPNDENKIIGKKIKKDMLYGQDFNMDIIE